MNDIYTTRTNNDPATDTVWPAPFGNLAEFLVEAIENGDQVQILGLSDDEAEAVYIGLGILIDYDGRNAYDPFAGL
jgi:hypothetical protein